MNCPNCESSEIYRKNPTERVVYCDRCNHSWQAKQPLVPIARTKVYMSRGPMRGNHYVSVWYCPINPQRYSFSLTYGAGVSQFGEFEDDPYLSGSYSTPEEALEAGIAEVNNDNS